MNHVTTGFITQQHSCIHMLLNLHICNHLNRSSSFYSLSSSRLLPHFSICLPNTSLNSHLHLHHLVHCLLSPLSISLICLLPSPSSYPPDHPLLQFPLTPHLPLRLPLRLTFRLHAFPPFLPTSSYLPHPPHLLLLTSSSPHLLLFTFQSISSAYQTHYLII